MAKSRWKQAGEVQWDDHPSVIVYRNGEPVRVTRWLQWKRYRANKKKGKTK